MYHPCFGEMEYDYGWVKKRKIPLFGKIFEIEVRIISVDIEDEITAEQQASGIAYIQHEKAYLESIEKLMLEFSDDAATRFTPATLYFKFGGRCALLCNDTEDDDGIAVCIIPEQYVTYQSDFL